MSAAISASSPLQPCERSGPPTLRVGGLTALTTTDYPGQLAAVLFCQGCPWACGYCHNPHLIPARADSGEDWEHITGFLQRRRGLLDAVVFSGGEPLYQRGLDTAVTMVRDMGFRVGLHTGGSYPDHLQRLLPQLDWVGLDIKAPFDRYPQVTGVPGSGERARKSLEHLLASDCDYEIRTTVHPLIFKPSGLRDLARQLASLGVRHYVLQAFRNTGCMNSAYQQVSATALLDSGLRDELQGLFEDFTIRGLAD